MNNMPRSLNESFASHMSRYVGVGLISGSIVHGATLGGSYLKYFLLILLGVLLFAIGILIEHRKEKLRELTCYILISVALSLGTGMVSGATQHYLDGPKMASILLPLGLMIAYLSLAIRDFKEKMSFKMATAITAICLSMSLGLYAVSSQLQPHNHIHSEENHPH